MDYLWESRIVGEDSLNVVISKLRKILGDSARHPSYIKTVPGRGYIWLKPCEKYGDNAVLRQNAAKQALPRSLLYTLLTVMLIGCGLWISTFLYQSRSVLPQGHYPAYDAQLKQVRAAMTRNEQAMLRGEKVNWIDVIERYRELIKLAPDRPEGYLGVAEAKYNMVISDQVTDIHLYTKEQQALVNKALSLAPDNPKAVRFAARLAFWQHWDFASARRLYQRLHALLPNDYRSNLEYAEFLFFEGEFEKATSLLDQTLASQPQYFSSPYVAFLRAISGDLPQAYEEIQALLKSERPSLPLLTIAHRVALLYGKEHEAFVHLLEIMALKGVTQQERQLWRQRYTDGGLRAVFAQMLENREQRALGQYAPPLSLSRYAMLIGDKERALSYLQEAFDKRYPPVLWSAIDPIYAPLRQDPRFIALIKRIDKVGLINRLHASAPLSADLQQSP